MSNPRKTLPPTVFVYLLKSFAAHFTVKLLKCIVFTKVLSTIYSNTNNPLIDFPNIFESAMIRQLPKDRTHAMRILQRYGHILSQKNKQTQIESENPTLCLALNQYATQTLPNSRPLSGVQKRVRLQLLAKNKQKNSEISTAVFRFFAKKKGIWP